MDFNTLHEDTIDLLAHVAGGIERHNMTSERERTRLYNEIAGLVQALDEEMEEVVPYALATEYYNGVTDAESRMADIGARMGTSGRARGTLQAQIHVEQVEAILEDTMLDLKAAYRTFESNAIDSIEDVVNQIKLSATGSMVTASDRRNVTKQIQRAFLDKGVTSFITVDGKRLPLDYYSNMVARTKMAQANTQGHLTRYEQGGVELVQIQSAPGTCEDCAAHSGMVYALNGGHPKYPKYDDILPIHPSCRCTIVPIIEEFLTDSEQVAIDRRVEEGVDHDPRTEAEKEMYAREQAINRRNNAEKKLYARMQTELGAEAPQSLGAFKIGRAHV